MGEPRRIAHSTPMRSAYYPALLRLLQISSPSLPTGSFAYSNGLETLVGEGQITDETTAIGFLVTLMAESLRGLDLPRLMRMHRAWSRDAVDEASRQSAWLYAARESREVQAQECQLASALRKILQQLLPELDWGTWAPRTHAEAYARAAVAFGIDEELCCIGYAFAWSECHVSALSRLLPLGPMAAQRALSALLATIPDVVAAACCVADEDVGCATPGLAMASAQHETQYSRLFRS